MNKNSRAFTLCAALLAVFCATGKAGLARGEPAGFHAPMLPSNHALLITVSGYKRSPLPGVTLDRETARDLAQRLGVPKQNIVELYEQQVTREGLSRALASMNQALAPGDKLLVYFSGHGARFFSKETEQCTESIVMQDMHVVTNREFASMLRPLAAKTDKTIVMLDACHAGGVAQVAASRGVLPGLRPKFSREASSPECAQAVNVRGFAQSRGGDFGTTDNNLVILAAARKNEVAWDTLDGGALTYNVQQCMAGSATDADHSGSISMAELTACVQARLDKLQKEADRQHATLAGNGELIAAFDDSKPPGAGTGAAADPTAMLNDLFQQRDDRWQVEAQVDAPKLKIGSALGLSVRSQRDGFVYVFYQGTRPDSFYLLFPNQLDSNNAITANEMLHLPRPAWNVTALGPRGTDHLLVMVTAAPRDFSKLSLPAEYVSRSGPFQEFHPSSQAAGSISQVAILAAATASAKCRDAAARRDLGVARECSNAFGAGQVAVEETE